MGVKKLTGIGALVSVTLLASCAAHTPVNASDYKKHHVSELGTA